MIIAKKKKKKAKNDHHQMCGGEELVVRHFWKVVEATLRRNGGFDARSGRKGKRKGGRRNQKEEVWNRGRWGGGGEEGETHTDIRRRRCPLSRRSLLRRSLDVSEYVCECVSILRGPRVEGFFPQDSRAPLSPLLVRWLLLLLRLPLLAAVLPPMPPSRLNSLCRRHRLPELRR